MAGCEGQSQCSGISADAYAIPVTTCLVIVSCLQGPMFLIVQRAGQQGASGETGMYAAAVKTMAIDIARVRPCDISNGVETVSSKFIGKYETGDAGVVELFCQVEVLHGFVQLVLAIGAGGAGER